jgi:hypothetical protein
LLGGLAGGCGLGGVPLGLAELSDRPGEPGEPDNEPQLGPGRLVTGGRGQGQQPGCPAQADSVRGHDRRHPAVRGTRGPVERIGRLAEHPGSGPC